MKLKAAMKPNSIWPESQRLEMNAEDLDAYTAYEVNGLSLDEILEFAREAFAIRLKRTIEEFPGTTTAKNAERCLRRDPLIDDSWLRDLAGHHEVVGRVRTEGYNSGFLPDVCLNCWGDDHFVRFILPGWSEWYTPPEQMIITLTQHLPMLWVSMRVIPTFLDTPKVVATVWASVRSEEIRELASTLPGYRELEITP